MSNAELKCHYIPHSAVSIIIYTFQWYKCVMLRDEIGFAINCDFPHNTSGIRAFRSLWYVK